MLVWIGWYVQIYNVYTCGRPRSRTEQWLTRGSKIWQKWPLNLIFTHEDKDSFLFLYPNCVKNLFKICGVLKQICCWGKQIPRNDGVEFFSDLTQSPWWDAPLPLPLAPSTCYAIPTWCYEIYCHLCLFRVWRGFSSKLSRAPDLRGHSKAWILHEQEKGKSSWEIVGGFFHSGSDSLRNALDCRGAWFRS